MGIEMPGRCLFCRSNESPDRSYLRITRPDGEVEVVCSLRACLDRFYSERRTPT